MKRASIGDGRYLRDSFWTVSVAAIVFFVLTTMASPRWMSVPSGFVGTVVLTVAHLIPLFWLHLHKERSVADRLLTLLFSLIAAQSMFVHSELGSIMVANLDAGRFWTRELLLRLLEVTLSVSSLPLAFWVLEGSQRVSIWRFIAVPVVFGAMGQVLFFVIARFVRGPAGLELWIGVRVLIMAAVGFCSGFLAYAIAAFRPEVNRFFAGGFTELLATRFNRPLLMSAFLAFAMVVSGAVRVAAEKRNTDRLVTDRLDEYFLSLSNLTDARAHGLLYQDLFDDLAAKRAALFGSAGYDPVLAERLRAMITAVESLDDGRESSASFEARVMGVNRRFLALGEPYFLEPHSLGRGASRFRFVLRYRVVRRGRYARGPEASVPMLRLRRIDDVLIDTPYTGLSYHGIGTVLLDHIEQVALSQYLPVFATRASQRSAADGKWAATRQLLRANVRRALLHHLGPGSQPLFQRLFSKVESDGLWRPTALRKVVRGDQTVVFDRLVTLLVHQTEVHEARHATDRAFNCTKVASALHALSRRDICERTGAEVRAYLTELVDGPIGPLFALSNVCRLVVASEARADAYFFAGIAILEGLWGDAVRRPDTVEVAQLAEQGERSRHVVMPISEEHPGWLSYSRIHGACADLSMLSEEALRARAIRLFEALFDEDYCPVVRRR